MIKQLNYVGNVRLGSGVLDKLERVETGRQRFANQLSPNLNYPMTEDVHCTPLWESLASQESPAALTPFAPGWPHPAFPWINRAGDLVLPQPCLLLFPSLTQPISQRRWMDPAAALCI